METKNTEQPTFDADYFDEISAAHNENLIEVRGVLAAQFYKYMEPEAWNLLLEAQRTSRMREEPDSVTALLLDPSTGGWLSQLVPYEQANPQTGTVKEKDEHFWWHILHGHAIAASAAIQAGVPSFSLKVPAWSGRVTLPGLGQVTLRDMPPADDTREMALLTATQDTITIEGCDNLITLTRSGKNDIPEWKETTRIVVDGVDPNTKWGVLLDDTNPYRLTSAPVAPTRDIHQFGHSSLHEQTKEKWIDLTKASMELLARDHPQIARDVSREVRSIAPLSFKPQAIRLRPYSASSSATAGGVELDYQHYPDVAAASLVHEGAHNKYYGLVLKDPFISETWSDQPYLNSPWRSDVRPATGHLLGIDAFSIVAEFWRQRLEAQTGKDYRGGAELALFEVAFLRFQVGLALGQIDTDSEVLTPKGQAFIDHVLRPRIDLVDRTHIPLTINEAAEDSVNYHIAMWRAHHYRPAEPLVLSIVQNWQKGEECPNLNAEPDTLVPGKGYYFDLWSAFHRLHLAEPDIFCTLLRNPREIGEHVQGAEPRDLLNFIGNKDEAVHDYCHELESSPQINPRTIVGLGFAMERGLFDLRSSILLKKSPQTYKAVLQKIVEQGIKRPDPIKLASWMVGGYTPEPAQDVEEITRKRVIEDTMRDQQNLEITKWS